MTKAWTFKFETESWQASYDTLAQSIVGFIEEQLYILWELTPTYRNWQEELFTKCQTRFDYHGLDHCMVHVDYGNRIVSVMDD